MRLRQRVLTAPSGDPAPGLTVSLRSHQTGDVVASDVTDADGWYDFAVNGHPGPCFVQVSSERYVRTFSSKPTGPVGPLDPRELRRAWTAKGNGILTGLGLSVAGSVLTLAPGSVLVGGALGVAYAPLAVAPPTTPDPGKWRADRVVARLTVDGGRLAFLVKPGTAAADRAATLALLPALTNDGATFEALLAEVVWSGATASAYRGGAALTTSRVASPLVGDCDGLTSASLAVTGSGALVTSTVTLDAGVGYDLYAEAALVASGGGSYRAAIEGLGDGPALAGPGTATRQARAVTHQGYLVGSGAAVSAALMTTAGESAPPAYEAQFASAAPAIAHGNGRLLLPSDRQVYAYSEAGAALVVGPDFGTAAPVHAVAANATYAFGAALALYPDESGDVYGVVYAMTHAALEIAWGVASPAAAEAGYAPPPIAADAGYLVFAVETVTPAQRSIHVYDAATGLFVRSFAQGGWGPSAIAIDPASHAVWVGTAFGSTGEVWGYSITGASGAGWAVPAPVSGLAVGPDGNLWVGQSTSVRKYSPAGALLATVGSAGTGDGQFSAVLDVAVSQADGKPFVLDSTGAGRVQRFSGSGPAQQVHGGGLSFWAIPRQ